ncbi:TonB-dependent receptor plug domain-containing protein [Dyadobacter sp. CY261]|uniref:TonB-dependent receptor plug domain-containing protein n=1 Tax=Dyadobacter sp. CY261 TaxID=2907203 RepID=UPI001F424E7C|nr:TonB-dependent receptor plug domain-containing protein [Dyadobacter sp. CY261]MCF0071790.1 TonB-dependent receptor plug domain-containing protein [Dyadobacter sp. CY261]
MPWKKNLINLTLISVFTIFASAYQWSEEDFIQFISDKLNKYRGTWPVEKAYLHLDKPYYVTGDTLWFKAYLAEGSLHLADSASNLLYVDLIEQRSGNNAALRRVQMSGGAGHGEFVLSDSIASGAYTIRAYTNWMRNSPEEFFFQKSIYVFNYQENKVQPNVPGPVDLQFFPEGGHLVADVNTRIAFKAVNATGSGQDVAGFVLSQGGDTVASFKSEHLGMGRFQFAAKAGETYQAFVRGEGGKITAIPFPKVEDTGYTMVIDNLSNPLKMRVIAYAKMPGKSEIPVHIVGHARGIVAFVAKGKIGSRGLLMQLPTTELPDGITHLTLFDDTNKPVCERLVFVNHARSLRVAVKPSKPEYKPREKVNLEVMVTDSAGKPVEANLSLAVTDAGQLLQPAFAQNIVSYLLLSSDLKGSIEQSAYYFDPENSERKIHLDYVMMTHGWTRFRWEDVLSDSIPPVKRYVEQGITLEGDAKRNNRKLTEKTALSLYLSNDSLSTFMTSETAENGHFTIYNLVFSDSLQLRLQGMNKKGNQNLSFAINPFDPPRASVVRIPFKPVTVDAQRLADFLKNAAQDQDIARKIRESRERLLREVTIKAKKESPRDARKLYSSADATLKVTQQMASGNMSVLDMLQGRVAGVSVTGSGMNAVVSIRGNRGEPLFVLDGMPVDKSLIASLNVYDVESIDVLKGPSAAIFGSRGGNGVIAVLTKRGNDNYDYSQDIVPGVLVTKIAGFHVPREFYSPKYGPANAPDPTPDFRSTIFWAPMLHTGRDGKARVSYYHSDATSPAEIQVEVLSPTGQPGFGKSAYSVR